MQYSFLMQKLREKSDFLLANLNYINEKTYDLRI